MAVVLSQPSPYRKQLLKIAKMLSREDVDELLFLSEDFVPQSEREQISSGVDFMRCLIRHGRVEPGNCYYLYFCLNEIGRVDLARSLAEFYTLPPLLFAPPSFSLPSQMICMKVDTMRSKQEKCKQQMSYFVQSEGQCISEWRGTLQGLMEYVYPLPCASDVEKILGSTLEQIPVMVNARTTAIHVCHFKVRKKYFEYSKYVQESSTTYVKLRNTLQGIQWRKQQHCYGYSRKHDVHSSLANFISELLGKQVVIEGITELSVLTEIISFYTSKAGHRAALTILKWLFDVIEVVVSSSLNVQSCEPQLTSILTQFLEYIYHWEIVATILNGTKILEKAQKDGFMKEMAGSDPPVSIVQSCPYLLGIFTCLLVLRYSAEATSEDWEQIKANFSLNGKAFGSMWSCLAGIIYRRAMECFQEEILQLVLKEVHIPGLQEVIKEILRY